MPQVEAHVQAVRPFERPTRLHLLDHRSGEDVSRPELHLAGQVALHVPLAVLVDEVAALSASGFRDQDAGARKARRVELDHLHVLQRDARPVGERHPVSRLDETVRREFVHATAAARREDRGLPLDRDHRPAAQVHGDDAGARTTVDDEARDEVLVEPMDAVVLHRRLEERVKDVEADLVRGVHGPFDGHAAERALAHAAVLVAGPGAAPMLEADDFLRAPGDEELDRVLVGEEVGPLDRVEGVEFEGVVIA